MNGATGADGIPDAVQNDPNRETVNYSVSDSDSDGIDDVLDLDADGDGIPDNVEAQTTIGYIAPDGTVDANGVDTAYASGITPTNTDGADEADYLDLDSDNEGGNDTTEAGIILSGNDADNDGLDDATDPTADYSDVGGTIDNPLVAPLRLPDMDDDASSGGDVDYRDATDDRTDTDNDGIFDDTDLDNDNDGILDSEECASLSLTYLGSDNGDTTDINGITITYLEGVVGGDGTVSPFNGEIFNGNRDISTLALNRNGSYDNNSVGWGNYVYTIVEFSQPTVIGNVIKIMDIDGFSNWEMASVIGFNGGTLVTPTYTNVGSFVNVQSYTVVAPIPGFASFPASLETGDSSISQPGDIDENDSRSHFNADFGTDAVDSVIIMYALGGPAAGRNGTQRSGVKINLSSIAEFACDADLDGIPDYLDLDSDNDGIFDAEEAGHGQAHTGGIVNGTVGADGVPDAVQVDPDGETVNYSILDTDSDGIDDILDLDADNDGIPDNVEAQTTIGYIAPDGTVDANGIDTAYSGGITPTNTDGADNPDYLDLDSDNEGGDDTTEAGITLSGNDIDNDGLDDATDATTDYTDVGGTIDDPLSEPVILPDADGDATSGGDLDFRDATDDVIIDLDADNDGILDSFEDLNMDGDDDPATNPTDTDEDGYPDYLDIDSDNDGIPDNVEAQTTSGYILPLGVDANDNGVDDAYENGADIGLVPVNTDGADVPDYLDQDSDNDNVPDSIEGHDFDHDGIPDVLFIGSDLDDDGLDDGYEGSEQLDIDVNDEIDNPFLDLPNTDSDNESDYRDADDDDDGIVTIDEDINGDGDYSNDDSDNDGIPDYLDPDELPDAVEVFNVITPNGDGVHDIFTITGLDARPDNELHIFNRWGVLVFDTEGYNIFE